MPRGRRATAPFLALLLVLGSAGGLRAEETTAPTEPAIRSQDLERRVVRLASDAFQGREAATEGGRLASAWLAVQMARAGLEPGGSDGTFFQPFPVPRPALGKGNWLQAVTDTGVDAFPIGTAWNPFLTSPNAKAAGSLVFAGYGITAPARNWDDYAGLDVRGKVVLVLRKNPGWNEVQHAAFVAKQANAARHGAAAILLCNDRASAGAKDVIGHWSASVGGRMGSGKIPYAFVSRALAAHLLRPLRVSLDDLETGLRASGPASRDVPDVEVEIRTALTRAKHDEARNVIGLVRGSDPEVADEVVVVGAHFDHLGRGRFGSLGGGKAAGVIHPGADDNASGTAAVVELGEFFAAEGNRPRRTVLFIALTGEEKGLLGARHWVEHPTVPLGQVVAMVNMDMIGRSRDGRLHVGGVGTGKGLADLVQAAGAANGLTLTTNPQGSAPSDSLAFFGKKIPVLFLFTGMHGDYHRPSDTADKIEYDGLTRIARFTRDVVRTLADRPERLVFTQPPAPRRPPLLGVRLGRTEDPRGVLIAGVTPSGPAAEAGLRAGDVIVAIGRFAVKTRRDLRGTLSRLEPGKKVAVVVLRGDERIELEIVPVRRGRR